MARFYQHMPAQEQFSRQRRERALLAGTDFRFEWRIAWSRLRSEMRSARSCPGKLADLLDPTILWDPHPRDIGWRHAAARVMGARSVGDAWGTDFDLPVPPDRPRKRTSCGVMPLPKEEA